MCWKLKYVMIMKAINKIIICRPMEESGGTLVLSNLCRLLRQKGYDAQMFYYYYSPEKGDNKVQFWKEWLKYNVRFNVYSLICKLFKSKDSTRLKYYRWYTHESIPNLTRRYNPFFNKHKTIVIYPEVVYGNFLGAKNVVRWLLYHYKYAEDRKAYGANDLFVCYRTVFNNSQLNPKEYTCRVPYFNKGLYCRYNFGLRKGNCYIIRKGVQREDLPQKFDGPIIDNLTEEEKVKVFNESEFCYSYDTQTFYTSIAAICGCKSIVVCEKGKDIHDYLSDDEIKHCYGRAYGTSQKEIEKALDTVDQLIKSLDFEKKNNEEVERFIKILEQRFGHIEKIG